MEDNHIDRLFKQALQQNHPVPPSDMWYRILQRLDQRKKRKKQLIGWSSGIAATFTLLFSFMFIGTVRKNTLILQKDSSMVFACRNQNNPNEIPERNFVAAKLSERKIIPEIISVPNPDFSGKTRVHPIASTSLPGKAKYIPLSYVIDYVPAIRKGVIPLTNKQAYETYKLYFELLAVNESHQKEKSDIRKKKIKLSLSGHFTPGYASGYYTAPTNNTRSRYIQNDKTEGIFSMGGGLKVTLSAGERWAFQTGCFYTQLGQQSEQKDNRMFYTGLSTSGTDRLVFSPLGTIHRKHFSGTTANAGLFSVSTPDPVMLEQVFGALEIPLAVKYKWNINKFIVSFLGGVSGSFIVSNKAYSNENGQREYIGYTESIRTFNVSTDAGLGLEYPVSRKVRIMVEPGFRYYLQSVSRDAAIHFNPCVFSVSTGIGVDF